VPYAYKTKVPVVQTRNEIQAILKKYGADRFMYFEEANRATIVFEANERRIRFDLPLHGDKKEDAPPNRRMWRALKLCVQAKLEAVESGIESFEEAFLAHVVMPDGKTVYEYTSKAIEDHYKGGNHAPLLPAPEKRAK
jgi:hypothetical protein